MTAKLDELIVNGSVNGVYAVVICCTHPHEECVKSPCFQSWCPYSLRLGIPIRKGSVQLDT